MTIEGDPLGFSKDYDQLPAVEPFRDVRCRECWASYPDAQRQAEDGVRILALLCPTCREKAREAWIATQHVQRRQRIILAAFQTGRPVLADSVGELRYADGDREPLAADVGLTKRPLPGATPVKPSWCARLKRWFGGTA